MSGLTGRKTFPAPLDSHVVAGRRRQILDAADETIRRGPFAPTWESLSGYHVPDWYTDAKFGIFIHWLAASVPAFGSEWYPRTMYLDGTPEYSHHRQTYGEHASVGYKDFLPQFTAANFDAADWLALFRRAGAQYVVPVAEHHDGYHVGHADLTRWSASRMGPNRDVVGELSKGPPPPKACISGCPATARSTGGSSTAARGSIRRARSRSARTCTARPSRKSTQPDEAFLDDWLARTVELVEHYDPELMWFDWWIEQNQHSSPTGASSPPTSTTTPPRPGTGP